jgi:hypothetical protein
VLEKFTNAGIDDTICVGQRRTQDKHERVLLFVKMRPGRALTKSLENEIRSAIKDALSARHVPDFIFQVEDIPVSFTVSPSVVLMRFWFSTLSMGRRLKSQSSRLFRGRR